MNAPRTTALPRWTHALAALAMAGAAASALAQDAPAGDPAAGAKKAAMCIGCHGIVGYQSSFPEIYKVPKISGQSSVYLSAALKAYRKGDRKHPTMRGIAVSLSDADIADLAAYYQSHTAAAAPKSAPAAATPAVQALLTKGNCVACHGENLNKPIDPSYPKLAGQHADYLYAALKAYQTSGNPHVGRANAIMQGQVQAFSHAELKQLADHTARLPGDLETVPQSRFR